jgi:hypothetical protein
LREKLVVCAITSAIGAITGAVIVLGARALVDLPTTIIALVSLALLWRYKIPEPIMVTVSGIGVFRALDSRRSSARSACAETLSNQAIKNVGKQDDAG